MKGIGYTGDGKAEKPNQGPKEISHTRRHPHDGLEGQREEVGLLEPREVGTTAGPSDRS